jgi:hypothetical protein
MMGWLEMSDTALSDRFSCQFMDYHSEVTPFIIFFQSVSWANMVNMSAPPLHVKICYRRRFKLF